MKKENLTIGLYEEKGPKSESQKTNHFNCERTQSSAIERYILGGPTKVKPTYIFVGKI